VPSETNAEKETKADKADAGAENGIALDQSHFTLSRDNAHRLRTCIPDHASGLFPNPGIPVKFEPCGIFGRPKFSSRSRMTLSAFRLRRYGKGALASARPTDGSRLDES
jgi:hypothetical protein